MKHFMIKYQFRNGTTETWHQEIGRIPVSYPFGR